MSTATQHQDQLLVHTFRVKKTIQLYEWLAAQISEQQVIIKTGYHRAEQLVSRYPAGIISWSQEHTDGTDVKARKRLSVHKGCRPKSTTLKLIEQKKEREGWGLVNDRTSVQQERVSMNPSGRCLRLTTCRGTALAVPDMLLQEAVSMESWTAICHCLLLLGFLHHLTKSSSKWLLAVDN